MQESRHAGPGSITTGIQTLLPEAGSAQDAHRERIPAVTKDILDKKPGADPEMIGRWLSCVCDVQDMRLSACGNEKDAVSALIEAMALTLSESF